MPTVLQFLSDALADAGACDPNQTPSAARIQHARRKHAEMVRNWSSKRLRLSFIPEVAYTLANSKGAYTIGPAGDFDTAAAVNPFIKPVYIQAGSVIVGTARRFPLNILTRPQWDLNNIKTLVDPDGPMDLFYDFGTPLGTFNVAPMPNSAQTMLLSQWNPLKTFADGEEELNVEDYYGEEYLKPMQLGLAIDLSQTYKIPVSQEMAAIFAESLQNVEAINNSKLSGSFGSSRTLDGPVKGDGSPVGGQ